MDTETLERVLVEDYTNYNSDEDPTGEVGHRLADAVTHLAKRLGKHSALEWIAEKRIIKNHSPEENTAIKIYQAFLETGLLMKDSPSIIKNILHENGYSIIEMSDTVHIPLPHLDDKETITYAKSLLYKYHLPVEPSQEL